MSETPKIYTGESDKTALVKRSNGNITPMRIATIEGESIAYAPIEGQPGKLDTKVVNSGFALTEQTQEAFAEELAGKPLRPKAEWEAHKVEQEAKLAVASSELGHQALNQTLITEIPAALKKVEATMAEVAVEPKSPDELLTELKQGLGEDDLLELRSYADAVNAVKRAQQNGEGDNSRYWQGIKADAERAMSPAAKELKTRYVQLYNRSSEA